MDSRKNSLVVRQGLLQEEMSLRQERIDKLTMELVNLEIDLSFLESQQQRANTALKLIDEELDEIEKQHK